MSRNEDRRNSIVHESTYIHCSECGGEIYEHQYSCNTCQAEVVRAGKKYKYNPYKGLLAVLKTLNINVEQIESCYISNIGNVPINKIKDILDFHYNINEIVVVNIGDITLTRITTVEEYEFAYWIITVKPKDEAIIKSSDELSELTW